MLCWIKAYAGNLVQICDEKYNIKFRLQVPKKKAEYILTYHRIRDEREMICCKNIAAEK